MTKAERKRKKKINRIRKLIIRLLCYTVVLVLLLAFVGFRFRTKEECFVVEKKVLTGIEVELSYHASKNILVFDDDSKVWCNPSVVDLDLLDTLISKNITVTIDTDIVQQSLYSGIYNLVGIEVDGKVVLSVQETIKWRKHAIIGHSITYITCYLIMVALTILTSQDYYIYQEKRDARKRKKERELIREKREKTNN